MIQYDTLYKMLIDETVRFITGAWEDVTHIEEDLQELIRDISKCFYDENGKYSSRSSAVRITMKSLERVKTNPTEKILIIRNVIISILFSEKYDSFNTPGDMYTTFEDFKLTIDKTAATQLKKEAGLSDMDVKSIKQDKEKSPAMEKVKAYMFTKREPYFSECIKYISLLD